MLVEPVTDNEWTIHALNIHGMFFERWCEATIEGVPGWTVRSTNYPVEYPHLRGALKGNESALDIRAQTWIGSLLLTLIIECKKNNPEFVNWIFFVRDRPPLGGLAQIRIRNPSPYKMTEATETFVAPRWDIETKVMRFLPDPNIAVCDEGREARGTYVAYKSGSKTKTSNRAIAEAAYQVTLASRAIAAEEWKFSNALARDDTEEDSSFRRQVILPVIVTTARLFACRFDAQSVHPQNGEIPYDDASLDEVDALIYDYAVPIHLQTEPERLAQTLQNRGGINLFTRIPILVVKSEALPHYLQKATVPTFVRLEAPL